MCSGAEILAAGQFVGGAGDFIGGQSEADSQEARAGDILASARDDMERTAAQQRRRRGVQKTAFGMSGVRLKGSAKTLTEEQIRLDEAELVRKAHNAKIAIKSSFEKAESAKTKGLFGLASGVAQGFGTLQEAE